MPVFSPDDPAPDYCDQDPFEAWREAEDIREIDQVERDRRVEWEASFRSVYPYATEDQVEAAWEIAEGDAPREIPILVSTGKKAPRLEPGRAVHDDSHALAAAFPAGEPGETAFSVEQGPSGVPVGRPRRGTNKAAGAEALLLQRTDAESVDDLRACLGRGPTPADLEKPRAQLISAIREIRRDSLATSPALAAALGVSPRAIERLAA